MRTLDQPTAIAAWLQQRVPGTLQADSRRLSPGDGFVAWPGAATDGRRFVADALASGAAAALVERDGVEAFGFQDERVLVVPGLKALAGPIASAFFAEPSAALEMVAVTGTNGKTSCAWWTAQLLSALGRACAVVGTLGIGLPPTARVSSAPLVPTGMTTPDPVTLQAQLRQLVDGGVMACAIEASSIGLVEARLNATRLRVAVFTNFTQDHLDYHGNMDAYWAAKAMLFDWPGLTSAVINLDDVKGAELVQRLQARGLDLWTVGFEGAGSAPRLSAAGVAVTRQGMRLTVVERDVAGQVVASHPLSLPLVGRYNLSNLLCVLGAARALGWPLADAVHACGQLTPVPGRMEQVPADPASPLVLVDYAHTPDALEKALQALQPLARQRGGALWVVVGCGGDRDAGKRPLMAAVAEREAAQLVLTSDNPRSEDPMTILQQMQAGLTQTDRARVEPDRALAIELAVQRALPGDVVLIAGKGHEDYQEVQGSKRPFSDRDQAALALARRAMPSGGRMTSLGQLLSSLAGARVVGALDALPIARVHTDTRSLLPGDLFVALRGERFDAHEFLPQARAQGAIAAIAHHGLAASDLPGVEVPDTRLALGELASRWRAQFRLPLIAVTGSNGKTTVTQMIASILRAAVGEAAHATRGNFNNDIGVPLTLLALTPAHRLSVVELGMNHPGEIAHLAAMAQPTVALVNNAQREHQEFMVSVEAVARENGAVIEALAADGVAVFPSDDAHTPIWQALAGARRVVDFSDRDAAAAVHVVQADWQGDAWALQFTTPDGSASCRLHVAGRHNLRNAMAAAACALAAGVSLPAIAQGLQAFEPVGGRSRALSVVLPGHALTVIDDSYNANPDSVIAAIHVLAELPAPRLLVLGDMGEVGEQGLAFHLEVLRQARACGIDNVHCAGDWMAKACAALRAAGEPVPRHWADVATLAGHVTQCVTDGTPQAPQSVLVKGSRFMRMERVVQALQGLGSPEERKDAPHAA